FGFPAVAPGFDTSYDSAVLSLAGILPQVVAVYNQTKALSILPQGSYIPRHFRATEAEWYAQDSWRATSSLTLTFGARYMLLQPPYETTGTQVSPTFSLDDFFKKRGQAMLNGESYAPPITFNFSGQANGKQPYWASDYGNIAPRFAFAWSPKAASGFSKKVWGGAGKSSIRAGYGLYYDHFGEGIVNSFDRNGSFGLTTLIDNPAATQSVDSSPRFTQPTVNTIPVMAAQGCAAPPCNILPPAPSGPFPAIPPANLNDGGFAITWGLDGKMHTPYSHVVNFSITRELPKNFVVEASYVGCFAHHLLQEEDMSQPVDLVDPKSGQDYFTAATTLAKQYWAGVPVSQVAPVAFFQNMFPNAAGSAANQMYNSDPTACGLRPGVPANLTATQAMYDAFACNAGNETTALFVADLFGFPSFATTADGKTQPYVFYNPQWSSLYAWRSIGNSAYNGLQLSLRKRMSNGLNFDFNYSYSKSIDVGSNAERINEFEGFGVGASQIINAWSPKQLRAVSDFDNTHQINANWVYELPIGRGKHFGSGMGG